MPRITTQPARPVTPQAADAGPPSSPLFFYAHAGLTAALLAGAVALLLLAVGGMVRFGKAPAAAALTKEDEPEPLPKLEGGRFQIELVEDATSLLNETAKLDGVLGSRVREAQVFRYKGGVLQCTLETEYRGEVRSPGPVPRQEQWPNLIGGEQGVREGDADSLYKEGYVLFMSMIPLVSMEEALDPLLPHFGAAFNAPGPAGPLHALVPYYHNVQRPCEYRLYVSAGPAKNKKGSGFAARSVSKPPIWTHFNDDLPLEPPPHLASGKNLEADKDLVLYERQRGLSTVRLKGRFLSDREAVSRAAAQPKAD